MSEIDALRELKDSLSYDFWDKSAYVALFAVFVGVVGEFVAQFGPWPADEVAKLKLAKAATLLLIAGLGGEIVTYAKNNAINGTIIGFLNDEAGKAYKAAGEAKERGDHLEALSNLQTLEIVNLQTQFGLRVPKVEQGVTTLQQAEERREAAETPLTIDQKKLQRATRRLPRSLRTVTLMKLADPVAGPSAENIKTALLSLKPRFNVSIVKLAASEFRGIIVCQRGADDVKVGKVLTNAGIVSEIKPQEFAPECKQIQQATYEDGGRGFLLNADPRINGTLIFVGHR